ncbi:hypothetical protein ACFY30_18210 [Streptomyces sp. NPDC000345]|uniref:hypothetical protein n=1 Tax=Streptomyces sp. NPDC000345 TaxID=3364537 RepID=UPI00369C360F
MQGGQQLAAVVGMGRLPGLSRQRGECLAEQGDDALRPGRTQAIHAADDPAADATGVQSNIGFSASLTT